MNHRVDKCDEGTSTFKECYQHHLPIEKELYYLGLLEISYLPHGLLNR